MIEQKDERKIWVTVKNILSKRLNTETLNYGSFYNTLVCCLQKNIKGYY